MSKLDKATFLKGDAKKKLKELSKGSVQTAITSPPYWGMRDYGKEGQLGLEPTPDEYVENLVSVFEELKNVLRPDGTFWLNIGDSYYNYRPGGGALPKQTTTSSEQDLPDDCPRRETEVEGLKEKDLVGMPWRVAFALQRNGWHVRSDIIWHKPVPMPESVKDRPTTSYEHIFLLTKNPNYYYDDDAIREPLKQKSIARANRGVSSENKRADGAPGQNRNSIYEPSESQDSLNQKGRNKRNVWTVQTANYGEAHFAVYPVELIEPCILAGSAEGDVVLDPFSGAGTTGIAALKNGRKYVGIDLNEEYNDLARKRIRKHKDVPANHDFW